MEKITSADSTTIAVESVGSGPAVVCVVGTFCDRTSTRPLADLLADRFTVHAYDRRGRGDSTDTSPYAVQREIEDLAAVLDHAGGTPAVYGHSNGAIIALTAAAAGLPIGRVAAYEPPWEPVADPANAVRNAELADTIDALLREGRPAAALELFVTVAFELPPAAVEQMAGSPGWAGMLAAAPTLPHECAVTGDQRIPVELLAAISAPCLVLSGGAGEAWATDVAAAVAAAVPHARHEIVPGQGHGVEHAALAPVLAAFLAG